MQRPGVSLFCAVWYWYGRDKKNEHQLAELVWAQREEPRQAWGQGASRQLELSSEVTSSMPSVCRFHDVAATQDVLRKAG